MTQTGCNALMKNPRTAADMDYVQDYDFLRKAVLRTTLMQPVFTGEGAVTKHAFQSKNIFHKANTEFQVRDSSYMALLNYYLRDNTYSKEYVFRNLETKDRDIAENRRFTYYLFTSGIEKRESSVIMLLHGLNEKKWDKYLPWAKALNRLTGKAVLLFPIAFHMNRAPSDWSDVRLMKKVSRERHALFPTLEEASFANAAISHRLQFAPHRFFLSGLQSYMDIIGIVDKIKKGKHRHIDADASIDVFAYSVGAFLGEILLLADPRRYFSQSKLFMFCGGSILSEANPVSRAILDSAAGAALRQYLESVAAAGSDSSLQCQSFKPYGREVRYFRSMLHPECMASFRQSRLRQLSGRIHALALEKDKVFPAEGICTTLKPVKSHRPVVECIDFPYSYTHQNPFPLHPDAVQECFAEVFNRAAGFLS